MKQLLLIFFAATLLFVSACESSVDEEPDGGGTDIDGDADTDTDTDTDTGAECVDDRWEIGFGAGLDYEVLEDIWVDFEMGGGIAFNEIRDVDFDPQGKDPEQNFPAEITTPSGTLDISGTRREDLFRSLRDGTVIRGYGYPQEVVRDLDNFQDVWVDDTGNGAVLESGVFFRLEGDALLPVDGDFPVFHAIDGWAADDIYAAAMEGLYHFDGDQLTLFYDPFSSLSYFFPAPRKSSDLQLLPGGEILYAVWNRVYEFDGSGWTYRQIGNYDNVVAVAGTSLDDYYVASRWYEWPPPDDKWSSEGDVTEYGVLWWIKDGVATSIWEQLLADFFETDPDPMIPMELTSAGSSRLYFIAFESLYLVDGGNSDMVLSGGILDALVDPDGNVWAVGRDGTVWSKLHDSEYWVDEIIAPAHEVLTAIAVDESGDLTVVGAYGFLARRESGGDWVVLRETDDCGYISRLEVREDEGWGICANRSRIARLTGGAEWSYHDMPAFDDAIFYPTAIDLSDDGNPVVAGQLYEFDSSFDDNGGAVIWYSGEAWTTRIMDMEAEGGARPEDLVAGAEGQGFVVGWHYSGGDGDFIYDISTGETVFPQENGEAGFTSIWAADLEHVIAVDSSGRVWFYDGAEWRNELVCGSPPFTSVEGDLNGNVYILSRGYVGWNMSNTLYHGQFVWD